MQPRLLITIDKPKLLRANRRATKGPRQSVCYPWTRRKAEWFWLLLCCILIFFRCLLLYYLLHIRKKDLLIFLSAKANHIVFRDIKIASPLVKISVFFLNSPTKRRHIDSSLCRVGCSMIDRLTLPVFNFFNQIGKSAFFAQQWKPPFL